MRRLIVVSSTIPSFCAFHIMEFSNTPVNISGNRVITWNFRIPTSVQAIDLYVYWWFISNNYCSSFTWAVSCPCLRTGEDGHDRKTRRTPDSRETGTLKDHTRTRRGRTVRPASASWHGGAYPKPHLTKKSNNKLLGTNHGADERRDDLLHRRDGRRVLLGDPDL